MYQAEFDMLSTGQAERALLKAKHASYEQGDKLGRALAHNLRHTSAVYVIDLINSGTGLLTDSLDINKQFQVLFGSVCI